MKVSSYQALKLFQDASEALAQVEAAGIRIDTDYLARAKAKTGKRIVRLDRELRSDPLWGKWRRRFGSKANMGNRRQLGEVLKAEGFETDKVTYKTGQMAVDEEFLAKVDHPFAKKYVEAEKLRKVKSTYLEGIEREVVDGRLHPFFHLNTARSMRGSSSQPNFQSIPVRDPEQGKIVRQAFVPDLPEDGHPFLIVENDFKTLEVNISCCYHHDPALIEYVSNPKKDLHRDMAAQLYKLKKEEVSKDTRYCGKNGFVFPSFYGSYWAQIAPRMWEMIGEKKLVNRDGASLFDHLKEKGIRKLGSCDPENRDEGTFAAHVREVEKHFWNVRFPTYNQWKKDTWEAYQKVGGFEYLTGFVVNGVYAKNDVLNYCIQGTAFHCLLWVLIRLVRWLRKNRMRSRAVGQIHDSIVGSVWEPELQDYLGKVRELVSVDLPKAWPWIIVPMTIEAEVVDQGKSWHDKREWVCGESGLWGSKDV